MCLPKLVETRKSQKYRMPKNRIHALISSSSLLQFIANGDFATTQCISENAIIDMENNQHDALDRMIAFVGDFIYYPFVSLHNVPVNNLSMHRNFGWWAGLVRDD